jgi:hypothetical protein
MPLPTGPFLVARLERLFGAINQWGSPFEYVLRASGIHQDTPDRKNRVAGVTECWVIFNFVAAWAFAFLVWPLPVRHSTGWKPAILAATLGLYPFVRLVEIVVFQTWTQVLGGYRFKTSRASYSVVSLRRSIVIAALLYVGVLGWFTGLYRILSEGFRPVLEGRVVAVYYSVVTMTTTGFGDIAPNWWPTNILVAGQILVGFFMAVLIISRVVGYLPVPVSVDPEEQPLGPSMNGLTSHAPDGAANREAPLVMRDVSRIGQEEDNSDQIT